MNKRDDIFLKQMRGVSPIKKNNRVKKEDTKHTHNTVIKNKKKQTSYQSIKSDQVVKKSEFNLEKIDIKKNLKKGSFYIDKKIDFHGKNLLESEERFTKTILDCYNNGHRCLLFITGKGLYKKNNSQKNDQPKLYHGVIRSAFISWAQSKKFSKQILSFEQASLGHGGDGAFYVYLRKKKN